MQYSPKLKKAMEQIKQIMRDNNIGGAVVLHTIEGKGLINADGTVNVYGFTEYWYNINTNYSAATIENDRFKVKGKKIHYPSKEDKDIQLANTVNLFQHVHVVTGKINEQFQVFLQMMNEMVAIDDEKDNGRWSSNTEQNN